MAVDIAPELYERIQKLFQNRYEKAKLFGSPISEIRAKLDAGTATFRDADLYAAEVGNMLSESMIEVLQLDQMPNGRLYYNIAQRTIGSSLEDTYGLVSSVAAEVQEELNAASGIGIKAVTPKVNSDRIHGLVEKATEAADQAALNNVLQSPVENLMMSAVDETVKTNAQLQAKAGLQPIIKRTSTGHCCDWCSALVGTYKYPDDVPDEIYHRHKNCRCTVEYIGAGKRQDVWSKKEDVRTESEAKSIEKELIAKKHPISDSNFITLNNTKNDTVRPFSIRKELARSDTGAEVLRYIRDHNVKIDLLYGFDNPDDVCGIYDPLFDEITIFCDKTKTIKETAKTVIHEVTHMKNKGKGLSPFAYEYASYEAEILHEKGILTEEDKRRIIKLIIDVYGYHPD